MLRVKKYIHKNLKVPVPLTLCGQSKQNHQRLRSPLGSFAYWFIFSESQNSHRNMLPAYFYVQTVATLFRKDKPNTQFL